MSDTINKIKDKISGKQEDRDESTFNILPHPANTNDPADLKPQDPPQLGGGLQYNNPEQRAFHATGPQIPTPQQASSLPPPKSRDELHARAAELNRSN